MLCVNAPRKPMARIHLFVSLALVIVCTVLAFTPLLKIVVTQETQDQIQNLLEYALEKAGDDSESSAEIKERVRSIVDSMDLDDASVPISLGNIVASSKPMTEAGEALAEMVTAAMESSKEGGNADAAEEKGMAALEKLKKVFLNEDETAIKPEVRDLVVVVAAIAGPMLPSGEDIEKGMNQDDISAMVAKAIPHMIGLVVAILLSVLIPVIYAVLAIISLVVTLRNLKEPDIGAAKLAKRMPKSIVHPLTVMLIPCLSATIQTTASTLVLAILAAVGTLVNLVFTRLHSWEKQDIAYANVVQATTLVSIGAYVFLFFQILKMGVFKSFLGKMIGSFAGSGASAPDTSGVALDSVMIFIAVLFALLSTRYLAKVLRRESLACTPKKKGGAKACHLVYALFLLLITIFPMIALGSTANNGAAFLTATVEQEYALLYGFIATCVMVLSEIVLLILRKVFGKNLTPAAVADVLSGVSLGPDTAAQAPATDESEPTAAAADADGSDADVAEGGVSTETSDASDAESDGPKD